MARKRGNKYDSQIKALEKSLNKTIEKAKKTEFNTALEVKRIMTQRKLAYYKKAQYNYKTALNNKGARKQQLMAMSKLSEIEAKKINLRKYSIKKDYGKDFNVAAFQQVMTINFEMNKPNTMQVMNAKTRFNQMFLQQLRRQRSLDITDPQAINEALGGFTPDELYEAYIKMGNKWEKFDYDKIANDENFIKSLVAAAEKYYGVNQEMSKSEMNDLQYFENMVARR